MLPVVNNILAKESLKQIVDEFPRRRLCHLPTPFERMANLSRELGGVNLFIKRDDQTGLAFGGNKSRKLDFIMADVLKQKADCVITWGGMQSNWCRQTAAAARRLGVKPILIIFKRASLPMECDGNLLLDSILGADIRTIELEQGKSFMEIRAVEEILKTIVEEERRAGNNPYIAPIGGTFLEGSMSQPLGAISYVKAFVELTEQAEAEDVKIDYIVHATGSGSTQAGLIAGAKLLGPRVKIIGISVCEDLQTITRFVQTIAQRTFEAFKLETELNGTDIRIVKEFLGGGYGILNHETTRALRLVAETEGVLLDPVYTGKAMAGLIALTQQGYFEKGANVVFLHTGGAPALFPYREQILNYLGSVDGDGTG
jgi:D-cysteine desulfhydrase family pyridoxal phosphate-dependent enzyme